MSLSERKLPDYTLGEELCNSISHGIGACLSIAALVLCVVRAAGTGSAMAVVSAAIYGAALIILYCNSTVYHALKRNKAKKVMRIIDHCSIFLLIASLIYSLYAGCLVQGKCRLGLDHFRHCVGRRHFRDCIEFH